MEGIMHRQPTKHVGPAGWYEHTDGTYGYYSWQGGGGVLYTALEITVPTWMDTFGPTIDQLRCMRLGFIGSYDQRNVAWCELAMEGDQAAIRECIRLQAGGV